MKERRDLKHLIPWIVKACDENLFPGLLEWKDKKERIFFVTWVHKSSENWEKSKSSVFEAWANYKKKLGEKDDRDLKAAFRNALRSKKNNLKEISRSRNERTWKIISDSIESITSSNKVTKPKQRKASKNINQFSNTPTTNSTSMQPNSSTCANTVYNSMMSNEVSLPPYQTLFHVSPPTPPKQQTDVYLDPQEELFHLQEEIMNMAKSSCDTYRVPSPLPIELLNSPSSPSSIMNLAQSSSFNDNYRLPSPISIEHINSPSSPSSIMNLDQSSSLNATYRFPLPVSIEQLNSPTSPSSIMNLDQSLSLNNTCRFSLPLSIEHLNSPSSPSSMIYLTQSSNRNDTYRVPSPLSIEHLNSPSSPSLFGISSEVDKNIPLTMNSSECIFNSPLDFNSLNNNGTQNESIVPNIYLNTWNQTNYGQNQFSAGTEIPQSYQQMLQESMYMFSEDC